MAKINIPQLNRVIDLDPSLSLMENLLAHDIPVASSCGGDGICGKCRMMVFPTSPLEPASEAEHTTLNKANAHPGERLSCQVYLDDNAMVETTYW
ncbi:MAG: (2Fe-2S)-binding protein [Bdellovibrionales bacterium]|nr:(2Fe-2S)-binding protein [Bdellovibrionales bacterium]